MTAPLLPPLHPERLDRIATFRTELRDFLAKTKQATEAAGLTLERYDLLIMVQAAVDRCSRPTVTSLCASLHMQQNACAELVNRSVEAGLLFKEQSEEDRREFFLRLTDEGAHRLQEAITLLDTDREAFIGPLRRIAELGVSD